MRGVLVVCFEERFQEFLSLLLRGNGYLSRLTDSFEEADQAIKESPPDVALIYLPYSGDDSDRSQLQGAAQWRGRHSGVPVLLVANVLLRGNRTLAQASFDRVFEITTLGFDLDELLNALETIAPPTEPG